MNRLGLCVHGLGPKHGVVCWCGCCCGGGGGGVGVGANSIPKIWHTQDLVTYACNMSWRWHTPDLETTLLLGREVRVDGGWGRGRQGTSAPPSAPCRPPPCRPPRCLRPPKGRLLSPPGLLSARSRPDTGSAGWCSLGFGFWTHGLWALGSGFWVEGSLAYGF